MNRLGIEWLSVFGLPPVRFVTLAADLGCNCISAALTAMPYNPHGYPYFSLRDDAHLRREMLAAMRDRCIVISLAEGFTIRPNRDVSELARDMDIMRELGAERLNAVSMDPDRQRTFDQFAMLAEMAAERGMESTVELCPILAIDRLDTALAAIRHVARPDFRLLLDMLHVARSGATPGDLAALDPTLIGYVQLCDAPITARDSSYLDEATFERMVPGDGELPLQAMLNALPPDGAHRQLGGADALTAEAGLGPEVRLRPCIEWARQRLCAGNSR